MVYDPDHVIFNVSKMANKTNVSYSLDGGNFKNLSNESWESNLCFVFDDKIKIIIIEDFVVYGIIVTFFTLVGVPLNIITILGFSRVKKLSSHTFLLQVLAGADAFFILMVFVMHSLRTWYEVFGRLREWDIIFFHQLHIIRPCLDIASNLAVWSLVLVSTDRYIAVYHPTHAAKFCRIKPAGIAVVIMIFYALAFNFHNFFLLRVDASGDDSCHMHQIIHKTSAAYDTTYNLASGILNVVLPIVLVTVMDTRMIIALRRSKKRMGKRKDEASSTATVVLVVLATTFILCEIPTAVENCHRMFGESQFLYEMMLAAVVFSVLNSFINFFVYIMIGKTFRNALKVALFEIFCCGRKKPTYSIASTGVTSMA